MVTVLAFVGIAAFGAVLRGLIATTAWRLVAINIVGSFVLGLLSELEDPTLTVVGVAGLGAFTSFSSFVGYLVHDHDDHDDHDDDNDDDDDDDDNDGADDPDGARQSPSPGVVFDGDRSSRSGTASETVGSNRVLLGLVGSLGAVAAAFVGMKL